MRFHAVALLVLGTARGEIRDVLKSAEIDAMFAEVKESRVIHDRSSYAVWLHAGPRQAREDADQVLLVRRGRARLTLSARTHDVGAGDVIYAARNTSYRIDPGADRFEYVAVMVFPESGRADQSGVLAPRRMPEVVASSEIDATFAKFTTNQPLHSDRNFTMNYVIYPGRAGPWEAHRGCVDIYFIRTGTATAQLGGDITNAAEQTPGEIRGNGVTGARVHRIGPGDIVLIPRNEPHHMEPGPGKLGYLLIKVWAE